MQTACTLFRHGDADQPFIVRLCCHVVISMWCLRVTYCTLHRAPKGVKYLCELTGDPATIQTEINGVTYFYACVHAHRAYKQRFSTLTTHSTCTLFAPARVSTRMSIFVALCRGSAQSWHLSKKQKLRGELLLCFTCQAAGGTPMLTILPCCLNFAAERAPSRNVRKGRSTFKARARR